MLRFKYLCTSTAPFTPRQRPTVPGPFPEKQERGVESAFSSPSPAFQGRGWGGVNYDETNISWRNLCASLWILCVSLCFSFLVSCTSEKDKPAKTDEPIYTLIFLDKTRSVNIDKAFVAQKYQQALTNIIEQNIRQEGDKLEVYFIHENTSKARALNLTVRSEMDDVSAASPTDREAAETEFTLALTREKAQIRQRVLQQLAAQNSDASNQETDIWASLPVIEKANETGATVKVYYLSDMIESVKGNNRRDFQVKPPKDNAQADVWAKADAEQLKRYTIGSPDITMILPFEPNASVKENNPAVTQYWQTLFSALGVGTVEEE